MSGIKKGQKTKTKGQYYRTSSRSNYEVFLVHFLIYCQLYSPGINREILCEMPKICPAALFKGNPIEFERVVLREHLLIFPLVKLLIGKPGNDDNQDILDDIQVKSRKIRTSSS